MVDKGGHKRQDTQWKRLYTYIYYIFYVKYHTCKYAYTYTHSPLSPSSWLRARRINWCERPCACIELHRVSPRVQSYIVSLFDYVIKTVSLYIWRNFNLNNNYLKTTRLPSRATLRHCCLTILGRRTFLPHLFLIRCIIGLFPLRLSYRLLRFQPDLCSQIAITIRTLFGEIIKATISHTVELGGSSAGGI